MSTPSEKTTDRFDDETLTAYVLGELDPQEMAAVEQRMERDAALRVEVDAIRETTGQLEMAFADEPALGLTEAQREIVRRGGSASDEDDRPAVIFTFPRIMAGLGLAAAACLVVVLLLPGLFGDGANDRMAMELSATRSRANAPREIERQVELEDERMLERRDNGIAVSELGQVVAEPSAPSEDLALWGEQVGSRGPKRAPPGAMGDPGLGGKSRGGGGSRAAMADEERLGREFDSSGVRVLADRMTAAASPSASPPPAPARKAPALREAPESELRATRESLSRLYVADQLESTGDEEFDAAPLPVRLARERFGANREFYGRLVDNPFRGTDGEDALSTFSVDVDTASYSNVRRKLRAGRMPEPDAVRIEEMINYFDYAYEPPSGEQPFSVNVETGPCPWNATHRLVRIGLRGEDVATDLRPATSLVFLIDVSGSMNDEDKLPLVKESITALVEHLTPDDRVAIAVYAGAAGLVLPPTYCHEKERILGALQALSAGGSTNGGEGIELAYNVAREQFVTGGVNRVILCTDGDFNVGVSNTADLERLIEAKRESGVFLSVLGFGEGNLQEDRMERLSNLGNGNFAYIDGIREAEKVLVREMSATLVTIAKDVKLQVEFNPGRVGAYRLIGYANRMLRAEDFNDDTKDAGEIGAGHTVTALYEIVPPGEGSVTKAVNDMKYQKTTGQVLESDDLLTVNLRYKTPEGTESTPFEHEVTDRMTAFEDTSADFRFAAAVASFGMLLRGSEYKGNATYEGVLDLATPGLGDDPHGDRAEFVELVKQASRLQR